MHIPNNRVVIEKVEEEVREGYREVKVQDSSTFKGRVIELPELKVTSISSTNIFPTEGIYIGQHKLEIGDILLFAQNSPDTHQITHEGKEIKFIKIDDILAVL